MSVVDDVGGAGAGERALLLLQEGQFKVLLHEELPCDLIDR